MDIEKIVDSIITALKPYFCKGLLILVILFAIAIIIKILRNKLKI